MEGLFIMGQNPAVGASNARLQRTALSKLKWLVVRDMVETESASWWYNSPEVEARRTEAGSNRDRGVPLSRRGSAEKEGCQTNTQRLHPVPHESGRSPGRRAQRELVHLSSGAASEGKAAGDPSPRNAPLNALHWPYATHGIHDEPNVNDILKEINGRRS